MAKEMSGRCLCGSITYELTSEPFAQALCHCEDCQRQTGTAFSVVIGLRRDAFTVEGNTLASIDTTGDVHGTATHRHFCSACGSPIFSVVDAQPDVVYVKAGTLDDKSWLEPNAEVFTRSAQPWSPHVENAVRFETMPT
ncbi:MAG: hypothetical protein QOJ29_3843 [Thermoleophilaceae bacterium]|jgi:hypothetical protein|nr:hypothetical protein [Thermoleophilaceae bacterium]